MKVFSNNNHLDAWRDPERGIRIQVLEWHPLSPVVGQYIEHPRSVYMIWNYLLRVGPLDVWRKILSRFREKNRNQKVTAVGIGIVLEAPQNAHYLRNNSVIFFAYNHPPSPSHVCIDSAFVIPLNSDNINTIPRKKKIELPDELKSFVGWSPFSGIELNLVQINTGLNKIALQMNQPGALTQKERINVSGITEFTTNQVVKNHKPTAVLFGFGNYAKTQIIPNIKKNLSLRRIHEVDPDQLSNVNTNRLAIDTSPIPRNNTYYDAWFIAGYHHTHAGLSINALTSGAYAIVEKPIATTWNQYHTLVSVIKNDVSSHFFACFHKRYSEMNGWGMIDLAKNIGQPIDMHCIVYEIPLPQLHWYNWPNSGSRLISNGCHWLDYFMFVNDYAQITECGIWKPRGSDVAAFVRLENDSFLVMSITDTGSQRLGVRDILELRSNGVTVRMIDGSIYESENRSKIIRRKKINPMSAYKRMYRSISEAVVHRMPGDPIQSLRSTELTLRLEDELKRGHK
jgi:predicted dehydrogenase